MAACFSERVPCSTLHVQLEKLKFHLAFMGVYMYIYIERERGGERDKERCVSVAQ